MKVLIAFYSRTGHTQRACQLLAEQLIAAGHLPQIEELTDSTSRSGIVGWILGVKDALLKRKSNISPTSTDAADFDLVVLATPVWAGTMTPALRTYIHLNAHKFSKIAMMCLMGNAGDIGTCNAMSAAAKQDPIAKLTIRDKELKPAAADSLADKVMQFAQAIAQAN